MVGTAFECRRALAGQVVYLLDARDVAGHDRQRPNVLCTTAGGRRLYALGSVSAARGFALDRSVFARDFRELAGQTGKRLV